MVDDTISSNMISFNGGIRYYFPPVIDQFLIVMPVLDVSVMIAMVVFWVALYFIGRQNRELGVPQMHELEDLMYKVLE